MIGPKCSKLLIVLIVWRVASVFIVQTSHVPDEYWQSLEVAHKLSFDYGYLTWEWQAGIRSYLYPFLISIFYSILKCLNLDQAWLMVLGPRVFQALLSAYADYSFYAWTNSKLALLSLCMNWYWYYCASRTLINSFETCLTMVALCKYPWTAATSRNTAFLWIVGFLVFARPTAAVIWLPLCLHHLFKQRSSILSYLAIGLFYLLLSTGVDSICYGQFILSPVRFFKINVLNAVSEQYGKMHALWYLFSGLPVLLGLNCALLPLALLKVVKKRSTRHRSLLLSVTVAWSLSVFSLLAHKEFRFILPLLPMLIFIIDESLFRARVGESKKKWFALILIVSNVLPGFYFSLLHQRGPLQVMQHLRRDLSSLQDSQVEILFLTGCHATPYYSHLHRNVSMRFLTCQPNLNNDKDYVDETDEFRMNPIKWLQANYLNNSKASHLPSHIVIDDSSLDHLQPFLQNYQKLVYCPDNHFARHGQFSGYVIYKYLAAHPDKH